MPWHTTHPSLLSRLHDPADQAAWREFDEQYGDLLLRFGISQGLQFSDAEDVRQIVMANLARALPKFTYSPQTGRFRNYLGQVARRAIVQFRRQNCPTGPEMRVDMVEAQASALSPQASALSTQDSEWERQWMHSHYRRAMHTIRATQDPRSVAVFEQLVAGRSVQQVAAEDGFTEAAVHKIKQRMRDRIKTIIQEQVRCEDEVIDGA